MRRNLLLLIIVMIGGIALAQQDPVLMCINGREITRSEFEYSYNKLLKNQSKSFSLQAFTDFFINNKLKIYAAEEAGMDTTYLFHDNEVAYRKRISKVYLTDKFAEESYARDFYNRKREQSPVNEVQVMHIFKYLPQTILPRQLERIRYQMDSLYQYLSYHPEADFTDFVEKYSDDKNKFWVGWLQRSEEFENIVFSLNKGEVSQPFFTPSGLHIVKLYDRKEMPASNEINTDSITRFTPQYGADKSVAIWVEKLKKEYRYTPDQEGLIELLTKGRTDKKLFVLDGHVYTGADFERFAISHPLSIKKQLDAFVLKSVLDYENSRLEEKYSNFRLLLQEYRDATLLSAITALKVPDKQLSDSIALMSYFIANRSNYRWDKPRFRGAVIQSADKKKGKIARKLLKKLPWEEWKNAIRLTFNTAYPPLMLIEQGTFAEGDNSSVDCLIFKKGELALNKSYPFTFVLGDKIKGPETYKEVMDQLKKDYRNHLDSLWIADLRAKSKVEIHQEVLKTVNNH